MRLRLATCGFLLVLLPLATPAHAQEPRRRHHALSHVSVGYLAPTREGRQIHTVYLDVLAGYEILDLGVFGLDVYAGVTLATASGFILQWDDHFVDVRMDTSAVGIGPTFLFRIEPLRVEGISFAADCLGSLLFFSEHFPPGGDVYNFAWRVGGTLGYQLTPRFRLELAVRWMHTSNGQGIGPFNPSYEGLGGYLGTQLTL